MACELCFVRVGGMAASSGCLSERRLGFVARRLSCNLLLTEVVNGGLLLSRVLGFETCWLCWRRVASELDGLEDGEDCCFDS